MNNVKYEEFPKENLLIPNQDKREYKLITLGNKLDILLIHEKEADIASASLSVNAGYFNDPDNLPGLAHFCEHLLFMGTEKYPRENEYSEYLSNHGGNSNAYTSKELTNYFFYVDSNFLEGALDRFSQFFISPLFDDSCTEREINAIDSENKKNLQIDDWREDQLTKSLCRPGHPMTKFGTGNLTTLKEIPEKNGINIRAELLKFHKKYYSSNIMKLAILGKDPMDKLCEMAVNMFSGIKNNEIVLEPIPSDAMTINELKKEIILKPVKDLRTLNIIFPFPDRLEMYLNKPGHYISHLIGHESEGSIFYLLKKKGWATSLCSGNIRECSNVSFFNIMIELTETGYDNYIEVIMIVFQYLKMLKEIGNQKWIFDECKTLSDISFQYKEKSKPMTYTSYITKQMLLYPKEHILAGSSLFFEYDEKSIDDCINCLNPDNFNYYIISQNGNKDICFENKNWQTEKYYGTEYTIRDIDEDLINKLKNIELNSELFLPKVNPFVPKDFKVEKIEKEDEIPKPKMLINNRNIRLWHKKDDTFFVPKTNLIFELKSPIINSSPMNYMHTAVFIELLKEVLNKDSYYAEIANTKYNIKCDNEGNIIINIQGYNDMIGNLLEIVINNFANLKIEEKDFKIIKERLIRSLRNFYKENPYRHSIYYMICIFFENVWSVKEKIEALNDMTIESLRSFIPLIIKQFYIEGLIHGNTNKDEAIKLCNMFIDIMKPAQYPISLIRSKKRVIKLKNGYSGIYQMNGLNPNNLNSSINYVLQIGDATNQDLRVKTYILRQIISEPCFDKLRTKEQLGYIVFSGVTLKPRCLEFYIIVQSEYEPYFLEYKVEEFLKEFNKTLIEMDDKTFEKNKSSVITKLLDKPENLAIQTHSFYKMINSNYYYFERDNDDSEYIKGVTKEEFIKFYNEYIEVSSKNRRKLSFLIKSTENSKKCSTEQNQNVEKIKEKNEIITNIYEFKSNQEYCPSVVPVKPILEYMTTKNSNI